MTATLQEPQVDAVEPSSDLVGRSTNAELRERTEELVARLPQADAEERRQIRDEVVTAHLSMASAASRRYRVGVESDDLLQVARSGLVEAFDRFDPSQASYASFAWVTMHGLLRRYLRDHGWAVRPVRSSQEAAVVLYRREPELTQRLLRVPSVADLAAELGWSADDVRDARRAQLGMSVASLDVVGDHGGTVADDVEWRGVEARAVLRAPLRALDEADRELVRLRFVEQRTQVEIAAALGVSQMQVSRVLARLLARLRRQIGDLDDSLSAVA